MQKIYILCYVDSHEDTEWEVVLVTAFTKKSLQKLIKEFKEASKEISVKMEDLEHAFCERWKGKQHNGAYSQESAQVYQDKSDLLKSHPVYQLVGLYMESFYVDLYDATYIITESTLIE